MDLQASSSRARRGEDAPGLPLRAQGADLRELARPEFRVQGRQAERRRLHLHARLDGAGGRQHSGRDRRARTRVRQPAGDYRLMRATRFVPILILALALAGLAAAEETITISGTVANATVSKPASGVTVTLVDPLGGMAEVATTKSNARGEFTFKAPPARGPRLLRAERAGVNYFKMIPPGVNSAELQVYDSASKVDGIKGTADVLRVQAEGGTLQAAEVFVITNASQPPRTLASPATFEFFLPDGSKIDEVHAQAPNGQPITVEAKPAAEKNRYAFSFALKPGDTKFQLNYHLPYSGQAALSPRLTRDFEHFVVVTPVGMTFAAKDPKQFQGMDSGQPGSNVQVSMQAKVGQELGYTISGTGSYPAEGEES